MDGKNIFFHEGLKNGRNLGLQTAALMKEIGRIKYYIKKYSTYIHISTRKSSMKI